jgi:SAM-dependent methyltransferase
MHPLSRQIHRIRKLFQGRISHAGLYIDSVAVRSGLEIGGPSAIFRRGQPIPLYDTVGSLDNCDFSSTTVWAEHSREYVFSAKKPAGNVFFCEGSNLAPIADASYDFLLSSHNLEHFANPIKALREWKRVLRPGGALLLILPDHLRTFDHRRVPTSLTHMMDDFEQGTGEDDLTHVEEILDKHDLSRDRAAGSLEQFRKRSLDNFNNRCLHHHVFDEGNGRALLTSQGFNVLTVDRAYPYHLCFLASL